MNANELADQVEMWGEDLLALNMKGGIPVIEGAKLLRQQQEQINNQQIEYLAQSYIAIAKRERGWDRVKVLIEQNQDTADAVKTRIKELIGKK
jgi:hypothetical protein